MGKTNEVKATEAMERMARRLTRTDEDQLSLIKKRRGKSLKEIARLTASISKTEKELEKAEVKAETKKKTKPLKKKKSSLPKDEKAKFKKGVRNAK